MKRLMLLIIFLICILIQYSLIYGFIDYEPNQIRLFIIVVFWIEIVSGALLIDSIIKDFGEL